MNSFFKNVVKQLNRLNIAYHQSFIKYPRVDNDFIKEKPFDLFPHPKLTPIHKFISPLKQNKFLLNKSNSLLFLSTKRIITPSIVDKIAKTIDYFFDKNLNFINKIRESEAIKIVQNFTSFLKKNNLTEKDIINLANKDLECSDDDFSRFKLYKLKNIKFFCKNINKRHNVKRFSEIIKKNRDEEEIKETSSLGEAIEDFRLLKLKRLQNELKNIRFFGKKTKEQIKG